MITSVPCKKVQRVVSKVLRRDKVKPSIKYKNRKPQTSYSFEQAATVSLGAAVIASLPSIADQQVAELYDQGQTYIDFLVPIEANLGLSSEQFRRSLIKPKEKENAMQRQNILSMAVIQGEVQEEKKAKDGVGQEAELSSDDNVIAPVKHDYIDFDTPE